MSRPGARFDRLSAADVSNFVFEHPGQSYAVAMVAVVDLATAPGAALQPQRLRDLLAERAATIPELNRRVHFTRWGQGRPLWLHQPARLEEHVRLVDPVAGEEELAALAAHLLAERLPRDRPLWDLVVVPLGTTGTAPDRVGLVVRIHHAVADGLAALVLVAGLFDPGPGAVGVSGEPATGPPQAAPEPGVLWRAAAGERVAAVLRGVSRRPDRRAWTRRSWQHLIETLVEDARRVATMTRRGVPDTCLLGPLSATRALELLSVDLGDVRAAAHRHDATVTDVVLAAAAGGLRALLSARGERLQDLPVSVPVSLRATPGASHGNEVGVMLVPLPVSEPDPGRRLDRVSAATRAEKARARAAGTFVLTRTAWSARVMDVLSRHQHVAASFVTSVPGPPEPMRLGGAVVTSAWPATVIAGNVRLALAVLSYAGRLHLTVISDPVALPDSSVFAHALAEELATLAGSAPEARSSSS